MIIRLLKESTDIEKEIMIFLLLPLIHINPFIIKSLKIAV